MHLEQYENSDVYDPNWQDRMTATHSQMLLPWSFLPIETKIRRSRGHQKPSDGLRHRELQREG